jgi:hypothetical protein
MAEDTDTGQDTGQDTPSAGSDGGSERDWKADALRFQSQSDKRDAENKSLKAELDAIKAAQEADKTAALKEQEKYKELFEEAEKKVSELTQQGTSLGIKLKLQEHLAENHPDYVPDFKWMYPHVTSEEDIASVAEDYVKAHPKTAGVGTASLGNTGKSGDGQKTVSQADLNNPVTLAKMLKEDPELEQKLASGELKAI